MHLVRTSLTPLCASAKLSIQQSVGCKAFQTGVARVEMEDFRYRNTRIIGGAGRGRVQQRFVYQAKSFWAVFQTAF